MSIYIAAESGNNYVSFKLTFSRETWFHHALNEMDLCLMDMPMLLALKMSKYL